MNNCYRICVVLIATLSGCSSDTANDTSNKKAVASEDVESNTRESKTNTPAKSPQKERNDGRAQLELVRRKLADDIVKRPDDAALRLQYIDTLDKLGEHEACVKEILKCLSENIEARDLLYERLAGEYAVLRERELQLEALTNALEHSAKPRSELYQARADLFMHTRQFSRAHKDYTNAIEAAQQNTYPLVLGRARAALWLGLYESALRDADAAVAGGPDFCPEAYALLALILAASPDENVRDGERAVFAANRAASMWKLRRKDVSAEIEVSLAAAYAEQGDFETASYHQELAMETVKGEVPKEFQLQLDLYRSKKPYRFSVSNQHEARGGPLLKELVWDQQGQA